MPLRVALLRTLVCVVTVRVALSVLPFRVVRRRLNRALATSRVAKFSDPDFEARVVRAVAEVRAASRLVPRASCLTQAIALQLLLHRAGVHTDLRIGVARDTNGGNFRAHAWLDLGGVTIIGGDAKDGMAVLPNAT